VVNAGRIRPPVIVQQRLSKMIAIAQGGIGDALEAGINRVQFGTRIALPLVGRHLGGNCGQDRPGLLVPGALAGLYLGTTGFEHVGHTKTCPRP
jgi:hypothetical protein